MHFKQKLSTENDRNQLHTNFKVQFKQKLSTENYKDQFHSNFKTQFEQKLSTENDRNPLALQSKLQEFGKDGIRIEHIERNGIELNIKTESERKTNHEFKQNETIHNDRNGIKHNKKNRIRTKKQS